MAHDNDDDVFLEDVDSKSRGPWRTIALVVVITLVAIWLVPGEDKPKPVNQPIAKIANAGSDSGSDSGAQAPAEQQKQSAKPLDQLQPVVLQAPTEKPPASGDIEPQETPKPVQSDNTSNSSIEKLPVEQAAQLQQSSNTPDPLLKSAKDAEMQSLDKVVDALVAANNREAAAATLPNIQSETEQSVSKVPDQPTKTQQPAPVTIPIEAPRQIQIPAIPGTSARKLVEQLDAANEADLDHAIAQAEQHLAQGQSEDAYLLLFYAARNGNKDAAFTLARHADPATHQVDGLFPEADERQALKWYRRADQAGHAEAKAALDKLHKSLKMAAEQGDNRAQRLLLQWD